MTDRRTAWLDHRKKVRRLYKIWLPLAVTRRISPNGGSDELEHEEIAAWEDMEHAAAAAGVPIGNGEQWQPYTEKLAKMLGFELNLKEVDF